MKRFNVGVVLSLGVDEANRGRTGKIVLKYVIKTRVQLVPLVLRA